MFNNEINPATLIIIGLAANGIKISKFDRLNNLMYILVPNKVDGFKSSADYAKRAKEMFISAGICNKDIKLKYKEYERYISNQEFQRNTEAFIRMYTSQRMSLEQLVHYMFCTNV